LKKRPDKKDALYRLPYQQYANLSEQFFDCMAEYNKVQCKFKQKYRERVQRQYRIVKEDVTEEEIDAALCNETGDSIFAQEILSPGHQEVYY
jgi:syntaxin 1B/2/3